MAKLKNSLPHMAGQSVNVNGTRFQIDANGLVEIDDPLVVDRLLQNKAAWSLVSEKPTVVKAEVAKVKVEKKVETQKVDTPKKVETPTPAKAIVREPIVEAEKEKETVKEEKPTSELVDDGWVDWPDPNPTMSISYLRQMADAYRVDYTIKMSKAELIKRIHAAMYDTAEDEG
jgi:hypothetical protein